MMVAGGAFHRIAGAKLSLGELLLRRLPGGLVHLVEVVVEVVAASVVVVVLY